jgi:hypothetical protein
MPPVRRVVSDARAAPSLHDQNRGSLHRPSSAPQHQQYENT